MRLGFVTAQATATSVAMLFNFAANNVLTYRDQRLRGWRFVRGLLSFVAICSVGAVANVGAASLVYGSHQPWWLAGVAGALVGAVWNYAVSSVVTWRKAL
jgi:dolichol-phosphate mannosyltransferase